MGVIQISAHSTRLIANCIIAYNATLLDRLYQKMLLEGIPQNIIDEFIRISAIAWGHFTLTGHHSFENTERTIDLAKTIEILEEKLRQTLWKKDKNHKKD